MWAETIMATQYMQERSIILIDENAESSVTGEFTTDGF